jgi:hypothetical protein
METTTVKTRISLPKKQYDLLKRRANELKSSLSKIVEQALDKYLEPEESSQLFTEDDPIWQIVGMVESDITDGSVNHDHYIYGTPKRQNVNC